MSNIAMNGKIAKIAIKQRIEVGVTPNVVVVDDTSFIVTDYLNNKAMLAVEKIANLSA